MRLRIDLHVHSRFSQDSRSGVDELIRRCRTARLDGFALTDHDTLAGVNTALARRGGLTVIPGLEVSGRGAHILALGVTQPVAMGMSAAETVERIHAIGGVAILAHPYSLLKFSPRYGEVAEAGFDAVEVANPRNFPYGLMLRKNLALAERLGLPVTGGSDAHTPGEIGLAYTAVEVESGEGEEVIRSIKEGRTAAFGRGLSLRERLKKYTRRLERAPVV